jgi:hypothetical protein
MPALNVDAGMHGGKAECFLIEESRIMELSGIAQQISPLRDGASDAPAEDRNANLPQSIQ